MKLCLHIKSALLNSHGPLEQVHWSVEIDRFCMKTYSYSKVSFCKKMALKGTTLKSLNSRIENVDKTQNLCLVEYQKKMDEAQHG